MKRLVGGVLLASMVAASRADIPPPPGGSGPWIGQATMTSSFNASSVANVDWVVLAPGTYNSGPYAQLVQAVFGSNTATKYLYAYQVESHLQNLSMLSIQAPNLDRIGFISNQGLNANGWGNHGFSGSPGGAIENPVRTEAGQSNATWFFGNNMDAGHQSSILWYTSDLRPTYAMARVQDSIPPTPGRGFLPVPVPAPGAAMLGVLGIALVHAFTRRRS